jgi:hypothetical protein
MYYSRRPALGPEGRSRETIGSKGGIGLRLGALVVAAGLAYAAPAPAGARAADQVQWMKGFDAPGTPKRLDRVGVLKIGPARARNVLVFNAGTSAGSAYIAPFARPW